MGVEGPGSSNQPKASPLLELKREGFLTAHPQPFRLGSSWDAAQGFRVANPKPHSDNEGFSGNPQPRVTRGFSGAPTTAL